jgi:hypothetical protein
MFILIYGPNGKLGKARLTRETPERLGRVASRLGITGLRTPTNADAYATREAFINLRAYVNAAGYAAKIETTAREADALLTAGLVPTNGGTYYLAAGGRVQAR